MPVAAFIHISHFRFPFRFKNHKNQTWRVHFFLPSLSLLYITHFPPSNLHLQIFHSSSLSSVLNSRITSTVIRRWRLAHQRGGPTPPAYLIRDPPKGSGWFWGNSPIYLILLILTLSIRDWSRIIISRIERIRGWKRLCPPRMMPMSRWIRHLRSMWSQSLIPIWMIRKVASLILRIFILICAIWR